MSVTMPAGRRVAAGLLGSALALLAAGVPAAAAPTESTGTFSVTAQRLVLEPTDGGYVGTLNASVTNNGPTATQFTLAVREPAGASFGQLDPSEACWWSGSADGVRLQVSCGGSTTRLEPGATQQYRVSFQVRTTPRDYAMIVDDGYVGVLVDSEQPVASAPFTTLFRSTKGSIKKPRPYVQASQTDISLNAGALHLDRLADGSLQGRMPLTVRYGNDAPSFNLGILASLPAGVVIRGIEPAGDMPWFPDSFSVPGGRFMPGEERSVDVILTAPAGTPAGDLGTGSYTASSDFPVSLTDVSPADNTASFTVTAADAS
ncbi:hypothetical protein RMN56_15005 [Micromonospora halotolerans]|uniref:DUF916 domain-containing protein n=1 Tax=Micromonospora halotolerans TaxID=709879 RepID=A0ABZ0A537_9ACTN|nr:hypothetical protein [Micromonospora halotolerans]WNM42562.1 hypothetical protein RMN56_15005 [Micromonospora halotolerans]